MNPPSMLRSSVSLEDAVGTRWDVIIIGAGVAGASLAIHSAKQGLRVLVVECRSFPREKVCGGCLNGRAQTHLDRLGVLPELLETGAIPIHELDVHVPGHTSRWPVPRMLSVRRSTLDTLLITRAIASGAHYLGETRATVSPERECDLPMRQVTLTSIPPTTAPSSIAMPRRVAESPAVVVAAGLSRSPLPREDAWNLRVAGDSRVGVQCVIDSPRTHHGVAHSPNTLHMVVGPSGYVGICETDGGFLDLAAALNPSEIRRQGSIGRCIQGILQECQFHLNIDVTQEQWSATPLLTRDSLTVAMRGVYLLGDSAGYVEPFTGEGMSWALAGAESLAAILSRSTDPARSPTRESDWTHWVSRHRRAKQSISKWVAKQARNTQRANLCLRLLDWTPPIRNFLVRKAMQ